MQKIKHFIIAAFFSLATAVFVVAPIVSAREMEPSPGGGGCGGQADRSRVLTFPTWYRGLDFDERTCNPKLTELNDIWKIVLNLVEMLIQIVGYVAAGYIVWGGFKYIKSQGNSQNIASAKTTIMNAAIGLGIALSSVAIVNFVSSRF